MGLCLEHAVRQGGDHDVYQDEPNHHVFINGFKSWWAKVQVMDLA